MKFTVDLSNMLVQPLPSPSKKASVRHHETQFRPCVPCIDKLQKGPLTKNKNDNNNTIPTLSENAACQHVLPEPFLLL